MKREQPVSRLADALEGTLKAGGRRCGMPFAPPSAQALCALAAMRRLNRTVLWVADGPRTMESLHQDVMSLDRAGILAPPGDGTDILFFPPREPGGPGRPECEPGDLNNRVAVLHALLRAGSPLVVATCVQALMQPTVAPGAFNELCLDLATGANAGFDRVVAFLQRAGFTFAPEVAAPSFASVRGGIVDFWPPAGERPVRVEFDGDMVESMRSFDPETQVSVAKIGRFTVTPAGEAAPEQGALPDYLPAGAVVIWSDFSQVARHAEGYEAVAGPGGGCGGQFVSLAAARGILDGRAGLEIYFGDGMPGDAAELAMDFARVEGPVAQDRHALEPDVMERSRAGFLDSLRGLAASGWDVAVLFDTPGALDRFRESHPGAGGPGPFKLAVGALSGGFRSDALQLAVVSESDLYGRRRMARGRYDPRAAPGAPPSFRTEQVADPSELEPGDLVVHAEHGIGRYIGISNIVFDGALQEVITIEYADAARLHVPVSHAHLLSRYIGIGGAGVALHRLGGRRWKAEKDAAEKAVADYAAVLLDTQAAREALKGHAFGPDGSWQREFEAAFPYRETPDQEQAIRETKRDMESPRPMDRLVCGDTGFGKTEIAVRAAFKAVMDGKQVAVLVPTTVLCAQHYDTFTGRMAAFPVRVESLSRFSTRGERDRVLRDLAGGAVDIVIGTHSLIQPGVKFADLGLVIVDEEQRFGVRHKERFKQMRRLVDVLTLTATPIPRTLYLSLMGIKDLSAVRTPPEHRLPVETIVAEDSDNIVRAAILRELNREGQVYYLHNRVMSIGRIRERLQKLAPGAKIAVGHGQMSARELEEVMEDFVAGRTDILLCTTIIESGMDISNVNTIIVDRADRFGLADLYQLRGRVGRSARKAYAYFLLPPHERIDPAARDRVNVLKRYSELGAGFNLAMRDLELRGAGNLLGMEQSGHVAAVGFLLYCRLLGRTVARMKGEDVPPVVDVELRLDFISLSADEPDSPCTAVVPMSYIRDDRARIKAYRRVAEAVRPADLEKLTAEFRDRYGPIPPALRRLMALALVRIEAAAAGISIVETRDDRVLLTRHGELVMKDGRHPRLTATKPDQKIEQIAKIVRAEHRG